MFETVPIENSISGLAGKAKEIFAQIFKPFQQAWEREGQATVNAALYALNNLGTLAKSVGLSMLEVWTNGTGVQIISTMLQIAQNLLLTAGNIAARFREAWNTNQVENSDPARDCKYLSDRIGFHKWDCNGDGQVGG